jgi:hypothetical protein
VLDTITPISDLIPSHFSPANVCHLLACTREFLADAMARGVLTLETCIEARHKISRAQVERLLGRVLTPEDVLSAWKAGEARRKANARYYARVCAARRAPVPVPQSPVPAPGRPKVRSHKTPTGQCQP